MTATAPARLQPSRTRPARTYEFALGDLDGTLTVTELPDGRPAEIFLTAAKQGSTLAGMCEALSIMTSLALQYQAPVIDVVRRLINIRFDPAGPTGDHDLPKATSLADYVARRLALDYLNDRDRAEVGPWKEAHVKNPEFHQRP